MAAVLQSGNVTPGHLASWVTDGVIQDGGAPPAAQQVIASFRGANFNTTADQPILIPGSFVAFTLTQIIVTNASLSLSNAQGGFYSAPSKGGSALVLGSQTYSALTAPTALLNATLQAFVATTRFSSSNLASINGALAIWFSLTTPQGIAATSDIYLVGINLT
jgi:hypothetical protein